MVSVQEILRSKGSQVYSIGPAESVYRAIEEMTACNAGALVVLDDEQLVGIVTERDYLRKIALKGRRSQETQVKEIMSSPVVTVSAEDSLAQCLATMTEQHCRHLPVMGDEGLAGLVSIGDLVKAVVREKEVEIHELQGFIQGRYG